MSFNRLVICLCVTIITTIAGVKLVGKEIDYYNSLPEPEVQAQFVSAPNGDEVEIPTIEKKELQKYYEIGGKDLLECLPDQAFSITKHGRNVYTFNMELEGKTRHFMAYFTRSHCYWNSSIVELKD